MSDIKTINISGQAATDMSGGSKKKRTIKRKQEGGDPQQPIVLSLKGGAPIAPGTSIASTAASTNSNTWLKYPVGAPVPPKINFSPEPSHIPSTPNQSAAPTNQYTQEGGTKHVRVELKKKQSVKRVHLNPKKVDAPKQHLSKKHQTRKVRKVTIGISSLHKRITRAKKVHKTVKDMPIDKLKERLVKGGLIKANSKAPIDILRQIAADAEVVAKKAL
jgi:hypothetical protein